MVQITVARDEISDREIAEMARLFQLSFGEAPGGDFAGRVREKHHPLALLAWESGGAVGYKLGYQRSRGVFYSWLGGVDPQARRSGVARALLRFQHSWLANNGYETVVTESTNRWKPMIALNLSEGFDIVGTYHEPDNTTKIVMRKLL